MTSTKEPPSAVSVIRTKVRSSRPELARLLSIDADSDRGKAMLDRFVSVALHAVTSNSDLLECTPESIVESIRQSAILGLEPTGALGEGAIVKYENKVRVERPGRHGGTVIVEEKVPTAQFQPMYRGLMKLARRSDQIAVIDANVVYQGDLFEIEQGTDPSIRHVPWPTSGKEARGGYLGAYAFARLTNGTLVSEWMTEADIESVRQSSRGGRSDLSPWVRFWAEMARKTVLRRLMKRLPLESAAEHAIRIETEAESVAAIPSVASRPEPASSAPRDRLRARLGVGTDEEPVPPPALASGDPPASEPPAARIDAAVAAVEAEEGVVRSVDDVCGAPSPFAEGAFCILDPHAPGSGHSDGEKDWL